MASVVSAFRTWAVPPILACVFFWGAAWFADPALLGRPPALRPLTAQERREVVDTIALANRIQSDFYASGGAPALLDEFPATKGIKHRVFREIGFLRDRGLVQVLDLADQLPLRAERTPDGGAEVLQYEDWNYLVQRAEDRAPATELRGMSGGFRYGLRREAGRWIIVSWEPERVERPASPTEFKY
jgi:hypothetical protein